jgi:hypothetical protein
MKIGFLVSYIIPKLQNKNKKKEKSFKNIKRVLNQSPSINWSAGLQRKLKKQWEILFVFLFSVLAVISLRLKDYPCVIFRQKRMNFVCALSNQILQATRMDIS